MAEQVNIHSNEVSFKDFLFKDKRNKRILWLAAVAIIVQFAVFKYFYPFASYIHGDSFSYLIAAKRNYDINTYLIGYSKFLRLISVFNRTDYVLAGLQYLLIESSALFFVFTIFYFYRTGKAIQWILISFMVVNPLFLHLSNLVSSDGLFLALSLLWFTLLVWIIHKPKKLVFAWLCIVLFIAFTVRYNAIIYPIITILGLFLSPLSFRKRLAASTIPVLVCACFGLFTMYKYKQLTGYWQYSPFTGWQMANNALYAYRYVDSAKRKPVPRKFEALDNRIREYFDSTRDTKKHIQESWMASTVYMWDNRFTLYLYRDSLFKNAPHTTEFKKWASMGPFYKQYGIHLIREYPWHYVRYFIWPNANKYYSPPIEFLQSFNTGLDYVTVDAKEWFGYSSTKVSTRMKNNETWSLDFYPYLTGGLNISLLFCLICYAFLKDIYYDSKFHKLVILGGAMWLVNIAFTILASSAALRFQSFPIVIMACLVALIIDWMIQILKREKALALPIENTYTKQSAATPVIS